jgi:hypothetical protein
MKLFLFLGFLLNNVFAQTCNSVSQLAIEDLDNNTLVNSNFGISNIINPIGVVPPTYFWNPSLIPSNGYYRINLTFTKPTVITSCTIWYNTNSLHSPTGIKFFNQPNGTLFASSTSLTSPYDFSFSPSMSLSNIYIEIYKSTVNQTQIYYLSCNTCIPSQNTTAPIIINNEIQSGLATILGGTGIGIASLSLVLLVLNFLSKQFKPDENGKRPSISQVFTKLFGLVKDKVEDKVKDKVKEIEEKTTLFIKDPANIINAINNPKETIQNVSNNIKNTVESEIKEAVSVANNNNTDNTVKEILSNVGINNDLPNQIIDQAKNIVSNTIPKSK